MNFNSDTHINLKKRYNEMKMYLIKVCKCNRVKLEKRSVKVIKSGQVNNNIKMRYFFYFSEMETQINRASNKMKNVTNGMRIVGKITPEFIPYVADKKII